MLLSLSHFEKIEEFALWISTCWEELLRFRMLLAFFLCFRYSLSLNITFTLKTSAELLTKILPCIHMYMH